MRFTDKFMRLFKCNDNTEGDGEQLESISIYHRLRPGEEVFDPQFRNISRARAEEIGFVENCSDKNVTVVLTR